MKFNKGLTCNVDLRVVSFVSEDITGDSENLEAVLSWRLNAIKEIIKDYPCFYQKQGQFNSGFVLVDIYNVISEM